MFTKVTNPKLRVLLDVMDTEGNTPLDVNGNPVDYKGRTLTRCMCSRCEYARYCNLCKINDGECSECLNGRNRAESVLKSNIDNLTILVTEAEEHPGKIQECIQLITLQLHTLHARGYAGYIREHGFPNIITLDNFKAVEYMKNCNDCSYIDVECEVCKEGRNTLTQQLDSRIDFLSAERVRGDMNVKFTDDLIVELKRERSELVEFGYKFFIRKYSRYTLKKTTYKRKRD